MKYQKGIITAIIIVSLLLLSSCTKNVYKNNVYENVKGSDIPDTNYTPEETVTAALDYLKSADINKFNQYICYPTTTNGVTVSAYNIMFSNDPDEETIIFIETIMSSLAYEIVHIQESDAQVIINANIINKDLSDVDIISYAETEDSLLEAIKKCDAELITTNIDIKLVRKDNIWKIVIDNDFEKAVSGGLFVSSSKIADEILQNIFE